MFFSAPWSAAFTFSGMPTTVFFEVRVRVGLLESGHDVVQSNVPSKSECDPCGSN